MMASFELMAVSGARRISLWEDCWIVLLLICLLLVYVDCIQMRCLSIQPAQYYVHGMYSAGVSWNSVGSECSHKLSILWSVTINSRNILFCYRMYGGIGRTQKYFMRQKQVYLSNKIDPNVYCGALYTSK